jgi:hypothetical protein
VPEAEKNGSIFSFAPKEMIQAAFATGFVVVVRLLLGLFRLTPQVSESRSNQAETTSTRPTEEAGPSLPITI